MERTRWRRQRGQGVYDAEARRGPEVSLVAERSTIVCRRLPTQATNRANTEVSFVSDLFFRSTFDFE